MSQLQKLLLANKKTSIQARAVFGSSTAIYIDGPIVSSDVEAEWYGGVSSQAITKEIRAVTSGEISLYINSVGGDVFAAQAIVSAMRDSGLSITAYIDGVAASAAGVIAVNANKVIMGSGALFMAHKGWGYISGNADDLRKTAELMDKIDGVMASQYVAKTGKSPDEITAMMAAETWFTSAEAKVYGLVDEITEDPALSASATGLDLSAYANAPKIAAAAENIDLEICAHRDRQNQRLNILSRLSVV